MKSPFEKDQSYYHRGDDAGNQFVSHIHSLGEELKRKIENANAEMIYGQGELEQFEKA